MKRGGTPEPMGRWTREHWPLRWTSELVAGRSRPSVFDLAEIRAVASTNLVAAGLWPERWQGNGPDDRALIGGYTRLRAPQFTQLHEAIGRLWEIAGLGALPAFTGGPIVAWERTVKTSDFLDLRRWLEAYEAARPDLAARVLIRYDGYSDPAYGKATNSDARPTESWDGSGHTRFFYTRRHRLAFAERTLDGVTYRLDPTGAVSVRLPSGEFQSRAGTSSQFHPVALTSGQQASPLSLWERAREREPDSPAGAWSSTRRGVTSDPLRSLIAHYRAAWPGVRLALHRDARNRPVRISAGETTVARLAYDGLDRLAKHVDAWGTVHHVTPAVHVRVTRGERLLEGGSTEGFALVELFEGRTGGLV